MGETTNGTNEATKGATTHERDCGPRPLALEATRRASVTLFDVDDDGVKPVLVELLCVDDDLESAQVYVTRHGDSAAEVAAFEAGAFFEAVDRLRAFLQPSRGDDPRAVALAEARQRLEARKQNDAATASMMQAFAPLLAGLLPKPPPDLAAVPGVAVVPGGDVAELDPLRIGRASANVTALSETPPIGASKEWFRVCAVANIAKLTPAELALLRRRFADKPAHAQLLEELVAEGVDARAAAGKAPTEPAPVAT